ncbi:hypothetical protein QVD17_25423 [Tagetes erecta]|uniref:Uncharacterized protein n=1 Tax=Tagetes erecta TaxID=13708 RepID=A0AAD8NVE2_TARER|nr:hypothetical protein QVD17_25423 [Tagetes erecta]
MDPSIVIKVKYGETLRRLIVSISESKLVLDMVMLKEKIHSFFNFGSSVVFTMTYVDEDGDMVTLVDDDDLLDVVRQSLNPLRITVNLNSSNLNEPSEKSTSLRSPSQTKNHVPERILAMVFLDLAYSKLSFSDPMVVELVKKLKKAYPDYVVPPLDRPRVLPVIGDLPNVNAEAGGSNLKKKEKDVHKVIEGVKFNDVQPPTGVNLNNPSFEYKSFQALTDSTKSGCEGSTGKDKNTTDSVEKKKDSSSEKKDEICVSKNEPFKHDRLTHSQHVKLADSVRRPGWFAASLRKRSNVSGRSSGWSQGITVTKPCPFPGMPLTSDTDSQGHHHHSDSPHQKRDYSLDSNDTSNIFHIGVCCDGCDVHPISGPRFKSIVNDDYDLCSFCFAEMGNAADYIRIDRPVNSFGHHIPPPREFNDHPPWSTPSQSKFDSQFIYDVNVVDGTIMAPLTAFTKLWKMRNNGSIKWPYGLQIQWIGGDRLSSSDSVDVEMPLSGLPLNEEVCVEVEFTAPELPGQYVSYWMMASPSGEKFGQHVWVSIQVDASMKNSGKSSINLNLPPVVNDPEAVNQDHLADNIFSTNDSLITDNGGVSSSMATVSTPTGTATSSVFDHTEVATALGSLPVGPTDTKPISYLPIPSAMLPFMPTFNVLPSLGRPYISPLPTLVVPPSGSHGGVVSDDQEQTLVEDLENMGFKEKDLNKEILRMNSYDMKKTVDDLCGDSDWDPMLVDELQEMGFTDDEANKRLLKKNKGSIKRVVMDLINGNKA